jgi:hypothetical protein
MAVKKLDRRDRLVDDMVRFLVRDPSLERSSNPLLDLCRRFEGAGNDELAATFQRVVMILRAYIALDDAEARVKPKPEAMPPRRRRARPRQGAPEAGKSPN